jgi:formylglycine-generating enzyme required for sulfatase activity
MSGAMRKLVPLVFISMFVVTAASCSLFVDLGSLDSGDSGASDASDEFCVCVDARTPDSASPQEDAESDSGTDAGINPCTSASSGSAGPRMVQADSYCIDSTEVTVAQYMQFVADGGAGVTQPTECAWNSTFAPSTDGASDGRCNAALNDPTARPDFPITCIDWCDAWSFCDWAGKRLCGAISGGPGNFNASDTNSQWYTACATPEDNTFPNDSADGGRCVLNKSAAVPVDTSNCNGGYPGLTDMVGNVEEWTDACNTDGEKDGGAGHGFDLCRDEGDEFQENFSGPGCTSDDTDNRNETWAGIGFRCCSK